MSFKSLFFINALALSSGLQGADLTNMDLRGANLSGQNLTGVNLEGQDLTGANLDNTILDGANLRGATILGIGANEKPRSMDGADLTGATVGTSFFEQAHGFDTSANDATFNDVNFVVENNRGSIITLVHGFFTNSTFDGADFSNAILSGVWDNVSAKGANFEKAHVGDGFFSNGIDFEGSKGIPWPRNQGRDTNFHYFNFLEKSQNIDPKYYERPETVTNTVTAPAPYTP